MVDGRSLAEEGGARVPPSFACCLKLGQYYLNKVLSDEIRNVIPRKSKVTHSLDAQLSMLFVVLYSPPIALSMRKHIAFTLSF